MIVSRKSRYAMRAVFELAKRNGMGPIKISDIADKQAIPPRFLEVILCQLKQGGYVDSVRGKDGGYMLKMPPDTISVGSVLRFFQGLQEPVDCLGDNPKEKCPLSVNCVFMPLWEDMSKAISGVCDSVSFQTLVEKERENCGSACEYVI